MKERLTYRSRWIIGNQIIDGNMRLDDGATLLLKLMTGDDTAIPFSAENAYIGIGNSSTEVRRDQAGLQGTTTFFKPVELGFPMIISKTNCRWGTTFGAEDANFQWNEVTLTNGLISFNRKLITGDLANMVNRTKLYGQIVPVIFEIELLP